MPEKPRRRKNKNKRKNNKNSSTDVNKNNIEESETVNESSSSVTPNITGENVTLDEKEDSKVTMPSEVSSTSNEAVKYDLTEQATDSVICAPTQVCTVTDDKSSHNTVLEQSEETNRELIVPPHPVLNETCGINEENHNRLKENKNSITSEVCSTSNHTTLSNNKILGELTEDIQQKYIVETPDHVAPTKKKCKLDNTIKSKSCDNDDCPTIVEIIDDSNVQSDSDNSLPLIENSNVIISEETDIEWEKVNHFNLPQTQFIQGILSSDTIPLNIVHCEEIKSLSPQEEISLRNYLHTLNLSTNPSNSNDVDIKSEIEEIINREIKYRLRKKGLTEDTTFIRAGPCRSLAVIDEEGSGDSSKTSRRHSYLSDKKSDNEELEDDVFECKPKHSLKSANINMIPNSSYKRSIPQPCIRVDAKLKEPEISEARGDWSMKTVERLTGAELVYLTDSSSSTSSIYDLNDEAEKDEETDASIRIITPTIEVTDTESLLSNTFSTVDNDKHIISNSCENECVTDSEYKILTEENKTEKLKDDVIGLNLQDNTHEIIILSTDNIKTDLFVKDVNETPSFTNSKELCKDLKVENNYENVPTTSSKFSKDTDIYDLEIKVLKCELNNAINNLIKEVISDSENNKESSNETFTRQDSSSSLDSSQCTAKYNPTHSSLNDVSNDNLLLDDSNDNTNKDNLQTDASPSHVKDVLQCVNAKPILLNKKIEDGYYKQPSKLRDLCVKRITSFPYGDKILEELAHVSLRLQDMSVLASERNQINKQTLQKIDVDQYESRKSSECKSLCHNESSNIPPPILPRKSSLKIAQDEPSKFVTSITEMKYECLSPSQKMLMEKTNTTMEKDFKSQPNVNIIHSETSKYSNYNEKKNNRPCLPTPMKSETGSRLLALLRDTSISSNLNTQTLEDKNLYQIPTAKPESEIFSKRLLNEIDSANVYKETTSNKKSFSTNFSSNSLKPVPPPKPKKLSTCFYESDEGSDFRENSFRTMHSNKKYFHYSTGNLNKEIEDDISSIQNMHRYCSNLRDKSYDSSPRRPSLPKDLCDQQMEYIRQKEKEVDAELRRLEQEQNKTTRNRGPRAPMVSNDNRISDTQTKNYINKDFTPQTHKHIVNNKLSSLFSSSQEELLREKMYSEYVNQMAEREQRKQHKVIKVTQTPINSNVISKSMPLIDHFESKMNNRIEQEFISKARERWYKLGIRDSETEDERDVGCDSYMEPKVIEHKIKVIDAGEEKDVKKLPSHMQEFVKFTVKDKSEESGSTGESNAEKASAHVVVFCAVIILVLTVGKFFLQLLRNK